MCVCVCFRVSRSGISLCGSRGGAPRILPVARDVFSGWISTLALRLLIWQGRYGPAFQVQEKKKKFEAGKVLILDPAGSWLFVQTRRRHIRFPQLELVLNE